jgi:hypothetical protein
MKNSAGWAGVLLAAAVLLSGCTGTAVNHPPAIRSFEPKGDAAVPEDGSLLFRVDASDAEGQALTCRWYVDGNLGQISGKPFSFNYTPGRAVGVHTLKAVVSDGALTAQRTWKVTVFDINHAPAIDAGPSGGGSRTVNEGARLAFTVNVTDPDGDAFWLRWTVDGKTVSVNTSAYTFDPDFNMSGAHEVRLTAGDAEATSAMVWNVTVVNVNRAPRLTAWSPPADIHLIELGWQQFSATAVDDDGDAVRYSWTVDGEPAGEGPAFNYTTGYFSAGNRTVAVSAGDGALSDGHSWSVRVDDRNRPPHITSSSPAGDVAAAAEYDVLAFSLEGGDDDGDALSVLWYIDNSTASAGSGAVFNYTPGYDSAGNRTVTAVLSDGTDSALRTWNVSVTRAVADWTVLAYMNGDCDLEPYLVEDLNEMEMAGSTGRVSIVAQLDRHPSYDATSGDWSGARRYRVEKDDSMRAIGSRLLEDLGEPDMGDPETLSGFLLWGLEKFPALRYQVVLSGHGDGWPGISQDFTSQNDRLTLPELSGALGAFAARRGAPIEVLELDVCYWAMLETDWALRNLTDYIVASEDIDPSAGQRYDLALGALVADPGISPRELSIRLVGSFKEAYTAGGYYPQDSETFTHSAVETARLGPLAAALDALCALLEEDLAAFAPSITSARGAVEKYGRPEYMDLSDFVRRLRSQSTHDGLNSTADAVLEALNAAVAANVGGTLRPRSGGISVFFPAGSYSYKPAYSELELSREHGWDAFLKAYYNSTGRSAGGRGEAGAPACPPPPDGSDPASVSERKLLNPRAPDVVRFTFAGGS